MKGLSFSVAIIQYPNVITMSSKIINLAKPLHSFFRSRERNIFLPFKGEVRRGWDLPEQYNYVFSIMVSLVIV